ncbi:hypothetical protein GOP47_0029504 [Adiantum capillus-veneris]|nr:hypothetical protein GOP47_0029504 [Adiantum capillus-veneris]
MADDDLLLPRTVEGVFRDYLGRRTGIIKALTTEVEEFYHQCDPERENQCLYGLPNETWKVTLPEEEVPPELPEPALGVNFARDGMLRRDWLALVAVHSDAWLMSVAFFLGARFDRKERNSLFQMINNLPTILDVVAGRVKPVMKDGALSVNSPPAKARKRPLPKLRKARAEKGYSTDEESMEDSSDAFLEEEYPESGEDDEYDDQENSICGICGGRYASSEFWIYCDCCKKWFHGKCVKVTPARAEHMKTYKCPLCIQKRPRPVLTESRVSSAKQTGSGVPANSFHQPSSTVAARLFRG